MTLLATVAKWRAVPDNVGLRGYGVTLALAGLALTLLLPPIYIAIDEVTGVPNLTRLLVDGLAVMAAWTLQTYVARLRDPTHGSTGPLGQVWLPLGTIAAMACLFALTHTGQSEPVRFIERQAATPVGFAYVIASMWYNALVCIGMLLIARDHARDAADRVLRLRLRLHAAAWAIGFAYTFHNCLVAALRLAGIVYPFGDAAAVSSALVGISALLNLNSPFFAIFRWGTQYRAFRRLYPLWIALCPVAPQMPLLTPRSILADILHLRKLEAAVYDRALGIADATVLLTPFRDQGDAEHAAALCRKVGLRGNHAAATIEAASLAAALRSWLNEARPTISTATVTPRKTSDVNREIGFLCEVADAFRRSPIVAKVRQEESIPATRAA